MNDFVIDELEVGNFIKKDKGTKKNNMKNKSRKSRNKKVKKFNIYLLVISIIWLFLIFLNSFLIFKYDVLPFKYLIIFLILIIVLPILLIFFLSRKRIKKSVRIFISIVGIIYIFLLSFSFYYLNKTFSFLDDFTSGYNYETKNYMVVVLKDSNYKEIDDLKDEKIGYVNSISHNINDAIKILDKKIKFKHSEYENYDILLESLDEKEISGIIMGDSYYQMLTDEDEDFNSRYKVIYTFSKKETISEIKKEVDVTKDTFNIYISGIDSYGNVSSATRSDVNIIVSINPKTNQILMVNVPRDYYVELPETNSKDKLTHAGLYGVNTSIKTIEELLDIEINYYFKVNYTALVDLIDALGGVDVYSKYSFTSIGTGKSYSYKKGYNHVTGEQALYFVRTRKAFADGDRVRGENQQAMIQAIIKKAMSSTILTKYLDILNSLKGSFITNMGTDKITNLVKMQLDKNPNWNVTSISLSGLDGSEYTYTYPYQKLYVMIPNDDTIVAAKKTLEIVSGGEKLDSSYVENTGNVNLPTLSNPVKENKKEDSSLKENEKKEEVKNNGIDKPTISTDEDEVNKEEDLESTNIKDPNLNNNVEDNNTDENIKDKNDEKINQDTEKVE